MQAFEGSPQVKFVLSWKNIGRQMVLTILNWLVCYFKGTLNIFWIAISIYKI